MKCLVFGSGIVRVRPDPVWHSIYVAYQLTAGWIRSVGKTWLGNDLFTGTYGALASSLLVLGVLWTFCWWLYRRKVFIRI